MGFEREKVTGTVRRLVRAAMKQPQPFGDDTSLLSSGLLDSMSLLNLVVGLETSLGLAIPASEVALEDFDSVRTLVGALEKLWDRCGQ
ncbi:MAG: phosphopantetheine-binding protein [Myxococcales bacterium]